MSPELSSVPIRLSLPFPSCNRSLSIRVDFGYQEAQPYIYRNDNEFLDDSHSDANGHASSDDIEEVAVQENRTCGVDESHHDERECENNGDRNSTLLVRNDRGFRDRDEVYKYDTDVCDNV